MEGASLDGQRDQMRAYSPARHQCRALFRRWDSRQTRAPDIGEPLGCPALPIHQIDDGEIDVESPSQGLWVHGLIRLTGSRPNFRLDTGRPEDPPGLARYSLLAIRRAYLSLEIKWAKS